MLHLFSGSVASIAAGVDISGTPDEVHAVSVETSEQRVIVGDLDREASGTLVLG